MHLGVLPAVALQEVERRVVCDAEDPRAKRRDLRREAQRVERFGERVLNDLFALDDRAGETRAAAKGCAAGGRNTADFDKGVRMKSGGLWRLVALAAGCGRKIETTPIANETVTPKDHDIVPLGRSW